ncbi:hypothetical protein ACIBG7_18575 [Nonomuraea sp. NPDC050328]|uniref:hypothetical protein n=1 Tax=Nonomuraea sp. NPDC050328 TaxID=3364361 RepID=UPI00378CE95D
MTSTRRVRARLDLELALADEHDRLEAAKAAHAVDPSEETAAAKRAAMASYAETRTWLRALARLREAERHVVEYANARDEKGKRKYAKAVYDLERIPREQGPLLAAMEALGQSGGA